MDKEEETGKASQGAGIQAAQIKGLELKEDKIRVAQMQGQCQSLGMGDNGAAICPPCIQQDIHWAPTT